MATATLPLPSQPSVLHDRRSHDQRSHDLRSHDQIPHGQRSRGGSRSPQHLSSRSTSPRVYDQSSSPRPPSSPKRNLQCALCLESYRDARILPCFHSFCSSCLEHTCLQQGSKQGQLPTVYCPVCMDETELTVKGIQGLPKNMYVQHLQELQRSPSPLPTCDLCMGSETATSHCESCVSYLCGFCVEAHKRQKKTSRHELIPMEDIPCDQHRKSDPFISQNSSRNTAPTATRPVETCETHVDKELTLFCDSCNVPVCQKCKIEEHLDHAFLPLDDVNMQYSEILSQLLTQAKTLTSSLNESIKNIEFTMSSIQEKAATVAQEICSSVDVQMRALQDHKRSLLKQLDAMKQHKENTLQMQLEELKIVLEATTVNSTLASKALRQGTPSVAFSAKVPIVSQLEDILSTKHDLAPNEDDYIQFLHNSPAGIIRGVEMRGVLDAKGPSAAHSVVEGEGLFEARQGKMSSFKVSVQDRYSQNRELGGDKIEVQMVSRSGESINPFISDSGDGNYVISYTPETVGEHRLSVLIDGKHVRASPFVVNVKSKRNKHRGTFHCCTFCSTEGKKHVRCGCGGAMPGGYSGCGHGHPGHPGCWHWSCCGNTVEKSECLR